MPKFISIIFLQWYLISRVFGYYLTDLMQLNMLTRNYSIFEQFDLKHSYRHQYSIGLVKLKLKDELMELLKHLNSTEVSFRLLNFTEIVPLFEIRLPFFVNPMYSSDEK